MAGRRPLAVVQTQPVHTADHRAAYAPALATVAFADRAARAEPHLRHGGARAHHRIRGRRGGNAHVCGRAGRVFGGARGVRSTITDFGTALWWAFVTVTTVGYGDFSPVTFQGKIIAVVLMFTGIALIGIVTATLASWIVDQVNLETDRREDAREKEVAKEAAQEAIAAVAAKARVPEGTKRAAVPGSAAAMPPSPEIELLREEVRELAAMVAGLRAELEWR